MPKRFLLLQGVSSPFFARLSDRLLSAGHHVFKVNFNCGDAAYWMPRPAWNFRDAVSSLLGARLTADTGEWGTYAWGEHVLGAPGYRIAGGSDEIQRNIVGERVLGLPAEPRVDKDVPFAEAQRLARR